MPAMLPSHARHATLPKGVVDIIRHVGAIREGGTGERCSSARRSLITHAPLRGARDQGAPAYH